MTRFVIHATVARCVAQATPTQPSLAKKGISPHAIRHTTATHLVAIAIRLQVWIKKKIVDVEEPSGHQRRGCAPDQRLPTRQVGKAGGDPSQDRRRNPEGGGTPQHQQQ